MNSATVSQLQYPKDLDTRIISNIQKSKLRVVSHPPSVGWMTITTTNETIIIASPTNATRIIVPLLAGNLPFKIHSCPWKYLLNPSSRIKILMPKNAAPSGLPNARNVLACSAPSSSSVLFNRNSCVTAIPIDAKAKDVRSQARNVRSIAS